MLSSLPVYSAISPARPESQTARMTSRVAYRLKGATLIATAFSISQNSRQNS